MKCGMATLTDLLESRRSTRRFDPDRDVAADVLERVLRAPLTMPHAGNTYDWRAVVLSRRDRDPDSWPRVFEALLGQSYVDEAAVVIVWAVQPGWWAENYRRNIADLVERRLLDPERAGSMWTCGAWRRVRATTATTARWGSRKSKTRSPLLRASIIAAR